MKGLIDQLRRFNAKERFWLINYATGGPNLTPSFRSEISDAAKVPVPENAWWAIDYHLDWLEAALQFVGAEHKRVFPEPEFGRNLNRNQEDIDMIVAWDDGLVTRVLLIEAKGCHILDDYSVHVQN